MKSFIKRFMKNEKGFALIQAIGIASIAIVLVSSVYRATNDGVTGWLGSIDNGMDNILAQSSLTGGGGGGTGGSGGEGGSVVPPTPDLSKVIPEGAYYINLSTMTFYDEMPATVSDYDLYLQGDYIYLYDSSTCSGWLVGLAAEEMASNGGLTEVFPTYNWTDLNQASYGPILETVNGVSVTNMTSTFSGCTSLTKVPVIPNSVTDMTQTFYDCTSLTDISDLVIPSSVTNMYGTFDGCTSLTKAPDMSNVNSVTDMYQTFDGCTSLTKVSIIPNSVTDMYQTFNGCTSLKDVSDLVIPSGVISMKDTFKGCTSLEKAPVIPSTVTNMEFTFSDCTSLTGEVEINATNLTSYSGCFEETEKPITITGITPYKAELAATANNDNVTY